MTRVLLLGLLAAASGFLPPTRRATPTHSVSMGAKKKKALVSPDGGVVAAPAIEEAEAAADIAADPTAAPAPAAAGGHAEAMGRFRTWPITAAGELEPVLRAMGLKIDARKIDGTSSADAALSDALVSVGASGRGGTGSFVSDDGLILTNWHVAHEAVRAASLAEGADFVTTGFVARNRTAEVRGPNTEVWRCVEILGQIEVDSADFWTNRLLSSSS